jgi:hypothetical protein
MEALREAQTRSTLEGRPGYAGASPSAGTIHFEGTLALAA